MSSSPIDQRCGHGRVYTAAQGTNCALVPYFFPNGIDGLLNEGCSVPLWLCFADFKEEVPKNPRAQFGMIHLGMELHGMNLFFAMLHGRNRIVRLARHSEPFGQRQNVITVAVPYL